MPLPVPKRGEEENEFVSRFMRNPTARRDFPDDDQRVAVAYSQWRKKRKEKAVQNHDVFQGIVMNLNATVRSETLEGRECFVAPVIMLTEGVHCGTAGPVFYSKEELAKVPEAWNGRPVVIYHPLTPGANSANSKEVYEKQRVGVVLNAKWDGKRLAAEAWLYKDRVGIVDSRVLHALISETPMEVSTGLFSDMEQVAGTWNSEEYTLVAKNIRPDHLAILPDQIGACSIQDGAGLIRNEAHPIWNQLSFGEIENRIRMLIHPSEDVAGPWVCEVYDNYFIAEDRERYFKQSYAVSDSGDVYLLDDRETVERIVSYVPVENRSNTEGDEKMDRKERIDELVANERFVEEDREFLAGLTDEQFERVVGVENEDPAPAPKKDEDEDEDEAKPVENKATFDELVANADPETRESLRYGRAMYLAERTKMVDVVLNNARNQFKREDLEALPFEQLRGIASLANSGSFAGQAEAPPKVTEVKPLGLSVQNVGSEK